MPQIRAAITALGRYLPERVVTNADLEKRVATTDEWIRTRTGIRERRMVEPGTPTSVLAHKACQDLLERRGIGADEIDLIIVATVTPDMFFPATACLLQDKLGARRAWGFDISGACCGFVYAFTMGAQFIHTGAHKKVLVVGADVMSSIVDFEDRATCVLFGDAAGAVLLEPAGDDTGLIDFAHEVDGSGGEYLRMLGGGSLNPPSHETVDKRMHYLRQEGQHVFKYASRKMAEVSRHLVERNKLGPKDIDLFVAHQANLRIIKAAQERLELPDEKVIVNIQEYGNTTAATIPLALASAMDQKRLKPGHTVVLAAVGAGFTVGATLVRWSGVPWD